MCYVNFDSLKSVHYPHAQLGIFQHEHIEAELCNCFVFAYALLDSNGAVTPRSGDPTIDIEL